MMDKENFYLQGTEDIGYTTENENESSLNEAYDKMSSSGAIPSLDSFIGDSDGLTGDGNEGIGRIVDDTEYIGDTSSENIDGFGSDVQSDDEEDENIYKNVKFNLKTLLDGTYFKSDNFAKILPYTFFLIGWGILFIANRNYSEKLLREEMLLKKEVKELKAESITYAAALMGISKETEVSEKVEKKKLGIHELKDPPMEFIIPKFERVDSLKQLERKVKQRKYYNDINE